MMTDENVQAFGADGAVSATGGGCRDSGTSHCILPPASIHLEWRRRGFPTRWRGDDARFSLRLRRTSPPDPEATLNPGDAMDHPSFSVAWPA